MTTNIWETGTHSDLIPISNHELYFSTTGPPRIAGEPILLLFSGLGGSCTSWFLMNRHLSPFIRTYIYDRHGLGKSPPTLPSSREKYAENAAKDLDLLLKETKVEGPYVLLAMSWGGIVAREFLERRNEDVVGMVMVECCTEDTCRLRPIDAPNTMAFLKGLDFFSVVGLRERHRLTPEEWQAMMEEMGGNGPQTGVETFAWPLTEQTLREKKQIEKKILGDRPISVIKGNSAREYHQVYEAGVAAGNGTEEQRVAVSKMIEGMEEKDEMLQKSQMGLSSVSHFVQLERPGHLVILEEPEAVVGEVRWVLEMSGKKL